MSRFTIGIDVHMESCNAHMTYGEYGNVPARYEEFINEFNNKFRTFSSGASDILEMARFIRNKDCYALIENSTKSHDIYWMCKSAGLNIIAAHATDLYQITKSMKKNDHFDAEKLAHYMKRRLHGEYEFAESFIPSHEWMKRREACRFIADDKLDLTKLKKQIRAYLLLHGINSFNDYRDITSNKALAEIAALKDTNLLFRIDKAKALKRRIRMQEKAILSDIQNERVFEIIYSVTGAGILTAAYLTSIIVDMDRFSGKKNFVSSFGIVPKLRESADSAPKCGITRRGDALARRLIFQMTHVFIRFEEGSFIAKKYSRLRNRGLSYKETIVACSNSLMLMIYVMLTNDMRYISDPEKLKKARIEAEIASESEQEQ